MAGMVAAALGSLLFAVTVGSWFQTLSQSFEVTSQALDAADRTVVVIEDALDVVALTLVDVDGVFSQTEETLGDVSLVILSTATLLNDEIPSQIEAIQGAMEGLIGTANVVDGILSALAFAGIDYDPEVPLDDALVAVNDELGQLSESFAGDAANLFSLTVSVNRLTDEISVVGDSLADLDGQIGESRGLVGEYREATAEARAVIDDASERLAGQIWPVRVLGLVLLVALSAGFSLLWWTGRSYRIQP